MGRPCQLDSTIAEIRVIPESHLKKPVEVVCLRYK